MWVWPNTKMGWGRGFSQLTNKAQTLVLLLVSFFMTIKLNTFMCLNLLENQ